MNERGPLIDVKCTECQNAYAVIESSLRRKLAVCVAPLFDTQRNYVCRRCRLVRFAEQVEELLGCTEDHIMPTDPAAAPLIVFHDQVKELHQELVHEHR